MTILVAGLVITKVPASSLSLLAFIFIGPLLILFILCDMHSRNRQNHKVSDCSHYTRTQPGHLLIKPPHSSW
jgi:hypothetical protein